MHCPHCFPYFMFFWTSTMLVKELIMKSTCKPIMTSWIGFCKTVLKPWVCHLGFLEPEVVMYCEFGELGLDLVGAGNNGSLLVLQLSGTLKQCRTCLMCWLVTLKPVVSFLVVDASVILLVCSSMLSHPLATSCLNFTAVYMLLSSASYSTQMLEMSWTIP